jgi:divalent metal cation (Fe/Co/Zn/Cd) transporter
MNTTSRGALVRRGRRLAWLTIGWNTIEGVVALASGAVAGSIALVGLGVDSFVEVVAAASSSGGFRKSATAKRSRPPRSVEP